MSQFGENIREARRKKGYSQEELADMMGISTSSIDNFENEQKYPSITNLHKISLYLEVLPKDLIHRNMKDEFFDKIKLMNINHYLLIYLYH